MNKSLQEVVADLDADRRLAAAERRARLGRVGFGHAETCPAELLADPMLSERVVATAPPPDLCLGPCKLWVGSWQSGRPVFERDCVRYNARRMIFRRDYERPAVGNVIMLCRNPECVASRHMADVVIRRERKGGKR